LAFVLSLTAVAQANPSTPATRTKSPAVNGQQPSANANQQNVRQAASENPLNLTEEQKAKLSPILVEEHQQLDMLRSDGSLGQEQKIQRANDIRSAVTQKIRAILTSEQFQKLLELEQQNSGESSAPNPSPATADNPQK
jgi:Spy/CpxP family protein refolding chaperone